MILGIPFRFLQRNAPVAMMQVAIDQTADRVEDARLAVGRSKGMLNKLARQVKINKVNIAKLERRIAARMKAGEEDGAKRAASLLAKERSDFTTNQEQFDQAQDDYDQNFKLLERHQTQVREAQANASKMRVQLDLSKANRSQAKLSADLRQGMSSSMLGEATSALQDQIDENRGIAETTRALGKDDEFLDDEFDEDANADAILAEFREKQDKDKVVGKAAE